MQSRHNASVDGTRLDHGILVPLHTQRKCDPYTTHSCAVWVHFQSSNEAFNLFSLAMPCNQVGEYLPPGMPPPPPTIKSPNDWMPFQDRVDFELTEFLYSKVRMSGASIDFLSQLWHASLVNHSVGPDDINLYEQNSSLLATIDVTTVGSMPWQGFTISYDGPRPLNTPEWMTSTHDIWYHDPCISKLWKLP